MSAEMIKFCVVMTVAAGMIIYVTIDKRRSPSTEDYALGARIHYAMKDSKLTYKQEKITMKPGQQGLQEFILDHKKKIEKLHSNIESMARLSKQDQEEADALQMVVDEIELLLKEGPRER